MTSFSTMFAPGAYIVPCEQKKAKKKAKKKPTYPRTVHLKNGQQVTQFNKSIVIEGDAAFRQKAVRDLQLIQQTKSGKQLLESIETSGKKCRIHATTTKKGNWAWTDPPPKSAKDPGYLQPGNTPGASADTEVGYDPDKVSVTGPPGSPYNTADWAKNGNRPADVGLFHELVHADDMMHGRMDATLGENVGPLAGTDIARFELRAAGLPPFSGAEYSENTYRQERGLPLRTFY